jgi:hypothetical protein
VGVFDFCRKGAKGAGLGVKLLAEKDWFLSYTGEAEISGRIKRLG